jgi:hypothetical protein
MEWPDTQGLLAGRRGQRFCWSLLDPGDCPEWDQVWDAAQAGDLTSLIDELAVCVTRTDLDATVTRAVNHKIRERVTRIELALSAWEADVLPLNYTREASPGACRVLLAGLAERQTGTARLSYRTRPDAGARQYKRDSLPTAPAVRRLTAHHARLRLISTFRRFA